MRALRLKILITIVIGTLSFAACCQADIVIMQDGKRQKGIVVEEYKDRIVLTTIAGEKQILREDTKQIIFDLEEQNLAGVADLYMEKGAYEKAYYYYSKALGLNPDYKKAKDGRSSAEIYIQQAQRRVKLDHIRARNEQMRQKQGIAASVPEDKEQKVKDNLGITVKDTKGVFRISDAMLGSPARKSGIKKGDTLLAVRGKNVSYMQFKEVIAELLGSGALVTQITIMRVVMLKVSDVPGSYSDLIGAKLGFSEMEGLVVREIAEGGSAGAAGVKKEDIIIEVHRQNTRYMPFKDVVRVINSRKGDSLSLKIKRDVAIWKEVEDR